MDKESPLLQKEPLKNWNDPSINWKDPKVIEEWEFDQFYGTCPDCGIKKGAPHLLGCDRERCTKHGEQAITCCGCFEESC